ncbi:unnamed protein product, partial [Polarella glacialis]
MSAHRLLRDLPPPETDDSSDAGPERQRSDAGAERPRSDAGAERQRPDSAQRHRDEGYAPQASRILRDAAMFSLLSGPTGERRRSRNTSTPEPRGEPQGGPPEPRGGQPEPRGAVVHEHRNFSAADRQLRGRQPGWQHEQRTRTAQQNENSSIAAAQQEDNRQGAVTLEQNREWPQNRRPIRLPLHTQQPQQMHSMLPPVRHSGSALAHIRSHDLPERSMSGEAAFESLLDAPEQPEIRHSHRPEKALQTIVSEEDWTLGFRPLRVSFMEGQDFLNWSRALELLQ